MLKRILNLLSRRERRDAVVLLLSAIVMAGLEVVTIGGIASFIAAIADIRILEAKPWFGKLQAMLGFLSTQNFLFVVGVALFALFLVRNAFGIFVLWYRLRFLHGTRRAMTARLLSYYLSRPYEYFLGVNSASIIKNITVEVNMLITTCLFSWIMLFSDLVMGAAIVALLLWYDPLLTGMAVVVVAMLAATVPSFTKKHLKPLGERYRHLNEQIFKITSEAIGGIKEIKLLGREPYFASRFDKVAGEHAQVTVRYMMITDGPRYFLEMIVVSGILLLVLFTLASTKDLAQIGGTMALFAAAAYRMMPLGHRMLSNIAGLQFNSAILNALADGLAAQTAPLSISESVQEPLPFTRNIQLRNVTFRYSGAVDHAVSALSLKIPAKQAIAFVGPTGAGKTTLVDLIAGLLTPGSGAVEIDGIALNEQNHRWWQKNIGYVPQHVYLLDESIRRNIAVGVADKDIDDEAVRQAAAMAHVEEFVAKLPEGYETVIGERGVRLSGGQRQRIGIARALYRGPALLILDEATSALDGIAESVIEDAIGELAGKVTVIIVAHRLTTVRRCDVIHLMDNGHVVVSGRYDDLMRDNATFRAMARAAE